MTGEYKNPVRVVSFNTSERWSEDVSEDVAREIRRRFDLQLSDAFRAARLCRGTKATIGSSRCGWPTKLRNLVCCFVLNRPTTTSVE